MNIAPSKAVPLRLQDGDGSDRERVQRYGAALTFLARLDSIEWITGEAPAAAAAVLGSLKLLIPLEGLIDFEKERERLSNQINKLDVELQRLNGQLSNSDFVNKAPAEKVEALRERKTEIEQQTGTLKTNLEALN